MKKRALVFALCAVLASKSFAQTAFDYLADSLINVLTVSTIIQVADYEYNGNSALWGILLKSDTSHSLSTQFDAGVEYLILAAAHNTSLDVDLKVYEGRGTGGTVIAKNTAPDAAPLVRFTPKVSGYHTFELINSSSSSSAFVSLVILKYRRNADFSFATLTQALENTLIVSQLIAEMMPGDPKVPTNQWVLFGGSVQEGSSAGYYNTRPAQGGYFLVGAGENAVRNCDAEVVQQYAYDNASGTVISKNTASSYPFDFALFVPAGSEYHNLKIYNRSSQKSNPFLFGFLILAVEN
jgi:hypothetical protein